MSRRFFRHGELPLVLLALVARSPRHGYEIMSELTRLFGPRYRASPGSVYPAIEALQTEGLIHGRSESDRTVYSITPLGERALEDRAEQLASLELRLHVKLAEDDSLESLLTQFKVRLAPLAGRVDTAAVAEILAAAAGEIEDLENERTRSQRKRRQHA
ncbi:MAG: PadR family transcriptional regulator [Thermoleophilaceae bacterium]|nr:PadR family transcriptional regulator [Thermoleophilaceae bacterium]